MVMSGWIIRWIFPSSPAMESETENTSDVSDLATNDNGLRHQQAFYALYLFMAIMPIVLFLIIPLVERRYNRKQQREMEQRRLTATKLAEPIREAHLLNLMEGYSMILSNSDICDDEGADSDKGGFPAEEEATMEVCDEKKNCEFGDDTREGGDDIEMQRPNSQTSDETDEIVLDINILECDNSECNYPSFCIPISGQRIGVCPGEGTSKVATVPSKVHSDGCVVCMNAFEVGQKISWSSNPECPHVFHNQCLLEWFVAVGTKDWKAKAVNHFESDVETIQKEICKFPKHCPFCRRDFFLEERQGAENNESNDNANTNDDGNDDISNDASIPTSISSYDSSEQAEEDLEQQASC